MPILDDYPTQHTIFSWSVDNPIDTADRTASQPETSIPDGAGGNKTDAHLVGIKRLEGYKVPIQAKLGTRDVPSGN